jgi:glucose-6-phosphate 1-epimerase
MNAPAPTGIVATADALPFLAIANPLATGRVYAHGAHVAQWRPAGHGEVLWMSARSAFQAAKPLRGGIPVCFPWFGAHPQRSELPAHGFARLRSWQVAQTSDLPDGGSRVRLALESDAETLAQWPHAFSAEMTVTIGATLDVELAVTNRGSAPMPCEMALHTYFTVGDVRRASVEGLDGASYLDRLDDSARKVQRGAIAFAGETDRLYLGTEATAVIRDPVLGRRITVAKRGSRSTVVWNPWIAKAARLADFADHEWPGMVCVETANADADRLAIAPGATHRMAAVVSVAAG